MYPTYLGISGAGKTAYKVLALVMLFIGGIATYTFVWISEMWESD